MVGLVPIVGYAPAPICWLGQGGIDKKGPGSDSFSHEGGSCYGRVPTGGGQSTGHQTASAIHATNGIENGTSPHGTVGVGVT